jgi:hypothetical protein
MGPEMKYIIKRVAYLESMLAKCDRKSPAYLGWSRELRGIKKTVRAYSREWESSDSSLQFHMAVCQIPRDIGLEGVLG